MTLYSSNPKALQLNGLDTATRKVTIGFKCNPKIKLKLAQDACKYGLTLSEYVENLILNLEEVKLPDVKINTEENMKINVKEADGIFTITINTLA
jgi:macrodomain Ter protein organizer (MatP/YcbG family)